MNFDKPVESHDKLGAADHSSVDQDALFEPILSTWGLSPIGYILLVFIQIVNNFTNVNIIVKAHIMCVKDVVLSEPFRGQIRKEDVRSVEKDRVEMYKSFRYNVKNILYFPAFFIVN